MEKILEFLELKDSDGLTNREKIKEHQKILRRLPETDKNKSYEEAGTGASAVSTGATMLCAGASDEALPAGIVMRDGRMIGFGIHILNEDIYPLRWFKIYFRSCHLTGRLDLSAQEDLLFVDIYHNQIEEVHLEGDHKLRILGLQDNRISSLDVSDLVSCQGIDVGKNLLTELDVSSNSELVELYLNDNQLTAVDLSANKKLKYFYCQGNHITELDTRTNQLLRHLDATGNPMRSIRSLAPQRDGAYPLELTAEGGGFVGLKYCPVYDAQWKETGEWQQSYHAYPEDGFAFTGWFDEQGRKVSDQTDWQDVYGTSRILTARFADDLFAYQILRISGLELEDKHE